MITSKIFGDTNYVDSNDDNDNDGIDNDLICLYSNFRLISRFLYLSFFRFPFSPRFVSKPTVNSTIYIKSFETESRRSGHKLPPVRIEGYNI